MIKLILTIVFSAFAFVSMGANECADVVLHEWDTDETRMPKLIKDETGREEYDGTEKPENFVTWVYDGTSFTPVAKVTADERYTIVHDYLGTPIQAYDSWGGLVWEMMLDVYGKVMDESRGDRTLVPFRYQGQYEDEETGLYYNRFRYYSPDMGMYISSDPIGLAGNNPTLYGYVQDINTWIDQYGLSGKGGSTHQNIQNQVFTDLGKIYGEGNVRIEGQIDLGNGSSRYGDIVVRDPITGKITEVHQVGDMRSRGGFSPSSRERGAIMDIRQSPDLASDAKIIFHDKKGRVALIDPDKAPDWKVSADKHRKIKGCH